jgi:hypothetical protein
LNPRAARALLGVLAAAPAFIRYADVVLNHFYRYGAVLLDTGLLADLAWHHPPALPGTWLLDGQSFFAVHIAPIFVLLSGLSWLVPVTMAQWFALFTGVAQALPAVAVYWLLVAEYRMRHGWRIALAVLVAIAFSFNGLAIAQVRYPHFEILLAASMMLFLVAWWRERFAAASMFFVLCLVCREDAGFHLAAVLAVAVALRWRDGVTLAAQRPALIFLALGLIYSVAALLLGMVLAPGVSSLSRVYLGSPPFAHVTALLLATRAVGLVIGRAYIFLPAMCAIVWAVIARNPYLLVGYIAFIPWTVLHLLAKSDLAGTFSSYYGFPYLVAMFWPLLGWRMRPTGPQWQPLVGFVVMIAASFTALPMQHNPSHVPLLAGFLDPPSFAEQARVERAMTAIVDRGPAFGRLVAGDSVASLRPEAFRADETLWGGPPDVPDTLLYFAGDRDAAAMAALAARFGLADRFAVAGTPMRVVTDRPAAALGALAPLLAPATR